MTSATPSSRSRRIIRRIKAADAGLVCLVGVQSNQFPRAMDLAAPVPRSRASGRGRRVSRLGSVWRCCPSCRPISWRRGGWGSPCSPARPRAGSTGSSPMRSPAGCSRSTTTWTICRVCSSRSPRSCRSTSCGRYGETLGAFDAGRGCPFQCSFCTIINVQGRKSRWRDADDVEQLVRANLAQGVFRFFITDDNFARNRNWEAIFDRLIEMREQRGARPAIHHPGRHAVPPHPEFRREGGARRLQAGLYRARKHQPRQSAAGQEKAEPGARIPPACSSPGGRSGSSPMPAISSAFPATRRSGSPTTSAPCSANCRSTCWNSSS